MTIEVKLLFPVVPKNDHSFSYNRRDKADITDEAVLSEGKAKVKVVYTSKPHHGLAVTIERFVLESVPNTQIHTTVDEVPSRLVLRVVDETGKQVGNMA